jgi:serine phosphatase RsbU (regulator of sigma subunit)
MHDELQLAASVQQQMLPDAMPEAEGLDFGVLFKPVGYVSGDIYDVRRLDSDRIGFFLADAVGHGVPAALLTMVLRRGLQMTSQTEAGETVIVPPCDALSRLNATLLRGSGGSSRFATAVYGVVRTDTLEVVVASAGHPPPLRVLPSGEVRGVETDGCLLGVFPDATFTQSTFTLEEGETLLLYSDGFETAFPADEARRAGGAASASKLHLERFARRLGERGELDLGESMRLLARDVDEQTGSLHQQDDLTALALARLAASAAGRDASRMGAAAGSLPAA